MGAASAVIGMIEMAANITMAPRPHAIPLTRDMIDFNISPSSHSSALKRRVSGDTIHAKRHHPNESVTRLSDPMATLRSLLSKNQF
ncbi:hypothetical protein MnTg02_00181 [bacterium MnTg02]|nr:hypothetical protein MnTg02_00181 [bacterium MnTg02]